MKVSIKAPFLIWDDVLSAGLTRTEWELLWEFMARQRLDHYEISETIWGIADNWPESWYGGAKQRIHSLNRKMRPFGWGLKSDWRGTYMLQKERELMAHA